MRDGSSMPSSLINLAVLLLVAVVLINQSAAQPASACLPTEPCCFADLPSTVDLGIPAKLATPSWMRACLSGIKTSDEVANRTVDVLLKGVVPMYSFANLAIDSLNTDSEVASPEADRVGLHDIKVDIASLIQDVYDKSRLESGGHNSLEFHFGLNRAFTSLNDAHTAYYTPFSEWILLSAVGVRPAQDVSGKLVFKLTQPTGSVTAVPTVYTEATGSPVPDVTQHVGKIVTAINGQPVEEYVKEAMDSRGFYKSPGGRLNGYLSATATGTLKIGGPGTWAQPDVDDTETYTFSDGTSETWAKIAVYADLQRADLTVEELDSLTAAVLEAKYNNSTKYEALAEATRILQDKVPEMGVGPDSVRPGSRMMISGEDDELPNIQTWRSKMEALRAHLTATSGALTASKSSTPKEHGDAMSRLLGKHRPEGNQRRQHVRRAMAEAHELPTAVSDNVTLLYQANDAVSGDAWLTVYEIPDALIYKINTFERSDLFGGWEAVVAAFNVAVTRAKEKGITNLMLDVSGNGGGNILLMYTLLRMLNNKLYDPSVRCSDTSDIRHTKLFDFLVENYSSGWTDMLSAEVAASPDSDIAATGLEVIGLLEAVGEVYSTLTGEPFEDAVYGGGVPPEVFQEAAATLQTCVEDPAAAPEDCDPASIREGVNKLISAVGNDSRLQGPGGLSMIDGGTLDPSTGQPFDPPGSGYLQSETYLRGGVMGDFTAKATTEVCYTDYDSVIEGFGIPVPYPGAPLHEFTRLVLLTDGTCGSACSHFSSKLQLEGVVTTVAYGGFPDEEMDTSAFCGGSVSEYSNFWRRILFTYFAGQVFFTTSETLSFPELLFPLPSAAETRFNFRETYFAALGPNALPREFYIIPAEKRLQMWPVSPQVPPTPENPNSELLEIWAAASSEFANAPLFVQDAAGAEAEVPLPPVGDDSGAFALSATTTSLLVLAVAMASLMMK